MAYYSNSHRQLVTYRYAMAETFSRLQEHLQVNSFVDIQAVTDVAANIGQSDMSLIHVQDAIDKATQTAIIAETLKQGVILQETTNCCLDSYAGAKRLLFRKR